MNDQKTAEQKPLFSPLSQDSEQEIKRLQRLNADLYIKYQHTFREAQKYKYAYLNSEMNYQAIQKSLFWRLTKPLRFVLDSIKKVFRGKKAFVYVSAGMHSLKKNGFKKTAAKAKKILNRRASLRRSVGNAFPSPQELEAQRTVSFPRQVKFSIVVPVYNTPIPFLEMMIESVLEQTYSNWELCIADGSGPHHVETSKKCEEYSQKDSRIRYSKLEKNLGISENTNACIKMATGEYIVLFDHDDVLHPSALYELMKAVCEKNADFIYTDEDTFSSSLSKRFSPHYKPDFSPDTLRSYNYICHLTAFKKSLLDEVGLFRKEYDGSQDYDMILRLTEKATCVVHIPKILYHWRAHKKSVAMDLAAKPYTLNAARAALESQLERLGLHGYVSNSFVPSTYKIDYLIEGDPKVSILIPNMNHKETLEKCIDSILYLTSYQNYQIVIIENNSDEQEVFDYYKKLETDSHIKVVTWDGPFNYSAINNFGARHADGEYLLLLNNDIEIITPGWIEEMLMYAQRKDVGAVGAKLYYPDNTIQHAGVILGLGGVAGHSHKYFSNDDVGYAYRLKIVQNLSAVTAACLLISKEKFFEVGGLDETFQVAFNDVDFCLRVRQAGYLNIFTPYAEMYHYESKSRGYEDTEEKQLRFKGEIDRFKERWGDFLLEGDPYYNRNLTLDREDFSFAE